MGENILEFPARPDFGVYEENCGSALIKYLKKHGDKICQIDSANDDKQTFNQLLTKSIRAAQHLETKGLGSDDVVTLCAYNTLNSSVPFLACLYLGIKISPIDPLVTEDDCWHFLNLVKPKMVFCEPECAALIQRTLDKIGLSSSEIIVFGESEGYASFDDYLIPTGTEDEFTPKKVDIDECAAICLSSGTTGLPKGTMVSHLGLLSKFKNPQDADDPTRVVLYVTTFCWISGITMFMWSVFFGAVQILTKHLKGDTLMQITEKYKVNVLFLNLFNAYNFINNPNVGKYDLSSLIVVLTAGAVLKDEVYSELKKRLPPMCILMNSYGLSEVCGNAVLFIFPDEIEYYFTKPKSVGKGHPNSKIKIVDVETREPVGPNVQGEICIKIDSIKGYYKDPVSTAAAFDSDGFFMTGDIGYYDEDKCFYVVDRVKDIFRCQGWPISPSELESVLLTHPDVEEAAAIGVPHPQDGERAMGIVVLKPGSTATEQDIAQFYNDKVSERKKLKGGLRIFENLPYSTNGKLRRKYLREEILKDKDGTLNKF